MTLTEPTRATREFLRTQAGTNAKLRRLVRTLKAKDRRAAVARAVSMPLTEKDGQ